MGVTLEPPRIGAVGTTAISVSSMETPMFALAAVHPRRRLPAVVPVRQFATLTNLKPGPGADRRVPPVALYVSVHARTPQSAAGCSGT